MNRKELVAAIAEQCEIEKKQADEFVQCFVEVITKQVAKGDKVAIPGFAKFARVDRKARMGRNPATGETIKIKASRKARITPLKALKDAALTGKVPASKIAKKSAKPAAKKAAAPKKAATKKATAKKAPAKKAPARKTAAKKTAKKK